MRPPLTSVLSAPAAQADPVLPPLVLHVTEALGGGLESALYDFVRSAPQYRHALLATRRGDYAVVDDRPAELEEVVDAGRGVRALLHAYGPTVERLQPHVVHLHSAWAGLVGRAAPGPAAGRIVYSPHGFYFERRDVGAPRRLAAHWLEARMTRRTAVVATVSPSETWLTHGLHGTARYVPNVVRIGPDLRWRGGPAGAPEVVLVGRVTAQKAPGFLLQVQARAAAQLPDVRWTWVGGGDPRWEQRLRDAGVEVTGWLPREEGLRRVAGASVYLHVAAWEGAPITLLEARVLGVPVVARSIPALDSLGYDPTLRNPDTVAGALVRVLRGGVLPIAPPPPAPDEQAVALGRIYADVVALGAAATAINVRSDYDAAV